MADPANPSTQPPVQQEPPVAAAPAQPAPQEPGAAAPSPEAAAIPPAPAVIPEPAPAAAPAAEAAKPPEPVPSLLQEFAKDAAKPGDKPSEPTKDAAAPKDGEKPKEEPAKAADKDAAKPAEAKAAEAPKPEEAKPAEAAKAAEPAKPEPVEYKYELPAVLKMDDATKGEVHALLDGFRADPTKGAQALIDFHAKSMTDYAEKLQADLRKDQWDTFNATRKQWATEVKADDEIGGAGYQTSMGAIARMRDLVAEDMMVARKWDDGSPRKSQLDEFLETTGAGDHPVFLKMMHRFARFFDEAGPPPPNPQPLPNGGQKPQRRMKDLYADGPQKQT